MTASSSTSEQRAPLAKRLTGRNGSRLFVTLLAAWIIFVSFTAQATAWVLASFAPDPGDPSMWWQASLAQAVLIGLPALIFAMRWRAVRYRAIFQSWAWATGYLLLLIPTRLLAPVESQLITLFQLLLTVGYWLVVRRQQKERLPVPQAGMALAFVIGGLVALPWLRFGALGSPLDIVLNVALAAAFGALTWTVLAVAWIPAQRRDPRRPRRDRFTSGLVTGVTLLILVSALSFNGVQLLLMLVIPPLGWAVVAAGATALATGVVVGILLLLIDSDPVVLVASDTLLAYYWLAAFGSMGIGWILALVSLLPQPDPARFVTRPVAWAGAAVALLLAVGMYFTVGNPGFFGDRVFVVLKDQADVSAAAATPELAARRAAVYQTLVEHADRTQADLRASLAQFGVGYHPFYLTNAMEINGGLLVRLWLMTRSEVGEVMVSPHLRPVEPWSPLPEEPVNPPSTPQWNLTLIGADRVWKELGVTGEGIVIGQSDSGVQFDHPEFAARYRGLTEGDNYNWLDPWRNSPTPYDESGHGTHTLGSILGENVGVAPGATWFACGNLIRNLGNPAFYLECMQFTFAPFPQGGDALHAGDPARAADVLNNSWGCPTDVEGCALEVFAPAVDALTQAGVFVVVSAGNDGPLCSSVHTPPAIYEEAFAVGAVDATGNLADFSSVGPVTVDGSGRTKPDILAPGVNVLSAMPGYTYKPNSGTSMAGPHVAGVVALMWSANPALRGDVARTRELLATTARPFMGNLASSAPVTESPISNDISATTNLVDDMVGRAQDNSCWAQTDLATIPNPVSGYGVVDAYAAVQAALALQ